MTLFDSAVFSFIILPLLIFCSRICDVSLGTLRIIFVSRGHKALAPLLGFFEVLIWLMAIGKIMQNLSNVAAYIAYAGGFAMGNYIGILIEGKIAVGSIGVRIITRRDASALIEALKSTGYGMTVLDAQGSTGKVNVIYTVIRRSALDRVVEIIGEYNPGAFYSVEDIRSVRDSIAPVGRTIRNERLLGGTRRKGK